MHDDQRLMDEADEAVCRVAYARGWAQVLAGQDPDEPQDAIFQALLELIERDRPSFTLRFFERVEPAIEKKIAAVASENIHEGVDYIDLSKQKRTRYQG